jgi:hypothetical protein
MHTLNGVLDECKLIAAFEYVMTKRYVFSGPFHANQNTGKDISKKRFVGEKVV